MSGTANVATAGERLRRRCEGLGRLEYVVESRRADALETWLVVRPHDSLAPRCEALGMPLSPGCRVVIDAGSLRPVGIIEPDLPPAPAAAGYNPYFDVSAA